MATKLVTTATVIIFLLVSCTDQDKTSNDEEMHKSMDTTGLASDVNLLAEMPTYSTSEAGAATNIERAFENAPPMIPHKTTTFIPITINNNLCLSCHIPENAKKIGATSMPETHFINFRPELIQKDGLYQIDAKESENEIVSRELGAELNMARYNCTQCHASQANVTINIENYFTADFRKASGKNNSNLIENLEEGVK